MLSGSDRARLLKMIRGAMSLEQGAPDRLEDQIVFAMPFGFV